MGVGGLVWLGFLVVIRMMQPSVTFMKRALSSTSTAEDTTNIMMLQRVYIAPFIPIGALYRDIQMRNKCPAARLIAPPSEDYDAYKRMLRAISDE